MELKVDGGRYVQKKCNREKIRFSVFLFLSILIYYFVVDKYIAVDCVF
jgi:hypothetical protein